MALPVESAANTIIATASATVGTVIAVDLDAFVSASGMPEFSVSQSVSFHEEDTARRRWWRHRAAAGDWLGGGAGAQYVPDRDHRRSADLGLHMDSAPQRRRCVDVRYVSLDRDEPTTQRLAFSGLETPDKTSPTKRPRFSRFTNLLSAGEHNHPVHPQAREARLTARPLAGETSWFASEPPATPSTPPTTTLAWQASAVPTLRVKYNFRASFACRFGTFVPCARAR